MNEYITPSYSPLVENGTLTRGGWNRTGFEIMCFLTWGFWVDFRWVSNKGGIGRGIGVICRVTECSLGLRFCVPENFSRKSQVPFPQNTQEFLQKISSGFSPEFPEISPENLKHILKISSGFIKYFVHVLKACKIWAHNSRLSIKEVTLIFLLWVIKKH